MLETYYFLKPARDGLFLAKIPWTQLPVVFILIAIVAVPVNQLHAAAGRKFRLNILLNLTMLFLILSLFVMRFIVSTGSTWAMYTFYIWVSIYGVLATSQFWLFANAIYSPTQAKRLFIVLNLGAIIGAFTGGQVTSFAIRNFGVQTENLLFFCIGYLVICTVIINVIWSLKRRENDEEPSRRLKEEEPKENLMQMFRTLKSSRHLALIVGIIAMTMATASFVDVQFKGIVQEHFTDDNVRTAFFGSFYGWLSLVSLGLQLFFSYSLLRILGVGGILSFLPLGLIAGSAAMLFLPGLAAGVLLRGSDGVFQYSLDKTGRELLFLPIPFEVKKRVKIFIDVIVDRWFRGVAGGLLLLFTVVLGFSIRQLSFVVLALLMVWLVFILLIRKEYVSAFRKALEHRDIDLNELRTSVADASTVKTLVESLASPNERQVVYALDMLSSVQNADLEDNLIPLLNHTSKDVLLRAMKLLRSQGNASLKQEFEKFLAHDDHEIRIEAMHFLISMDKEDQAGTIRKFLKQKDPVLKATAIVCISESSIPEAIQTIDKSVIESLLHVQGDDCVICRKLVARAVGNLNNGLYNEYLLTLLDDQSPEVIREAIAGIGRTRDRRFIPVLIDMFSKKHFKKEVREALAAYGKGVVGTLNDYLLDTSVDMRVRNNIPAILSQIPAHESITVLINSLESADFLLKRRIVKAINKLHSRFPDIPVNLQRVDSAFVDQTKTYYEILQILQVHKQFGNGEAGRLLKQSLEEALEKNLEQIFRLLGLKYNPKDILFAYLGITSNKKNLRDNAIEFLDNVLGKEQKKYLFPILDRDADEIAIRQGQQLFDISKMSLADSLEYLLSGKNSWLKTCALYYLKDSDLKSQELLRSLIKEAVDDENEFVKETAVHVLNKQGK